MEEQKMPEQLKEEEIVPLDPELNEMLENAVHLGRRKTRQHPKIAPYIFGVRNSVSIFDLEKTREKLAEALDYLVKAAEAGKVVLFVDTRPMTRAETERVAKEVEMPYAVERWSGGTLTNWKTISKRIEYLESLEAKMQSEEFTKYTKKEQQDMKEEARKLNILWGGIKNMKKLPDLLFVVDMRKNLSAVREAKKIGITVVGIADSNVDPTLATYPIPANDDALLSVRYILNRVKDAIVEGKGKIKVNA
jgi:small subunit ribosomal protein S2